MDPQKRKKKYFIICRQGGGKGGFDKYQTFFVVVEGFPKQTCN